MPPSSPLVGLTIAGTDPTSGAGVSVDMQVCRDFGLHPMMAITAILAQNSQGVRRLEALDAGLVRAQLEAIVDDRTPDVVKIGLLPTVAIVEVVAAWLAGLGAEVPVVLDPVMASGINGQVLVETELPGAMLELLPPHVDIWTPNLPEARILTGLGDGDGATLAQTLVDRGTARAVLLKMGHAEQSGRQEVVDLWADPVAGVVELEALAAIEEDVRGTGCQLASALAASLARGHQGREAAELARRYLGELLHGSRYRLGTGRAQILRLQELRS